MSKRWFAGVGFVFLIAFVVFIVGYSSANSVTGYGLFDRFRINDAARLPTNIAQDLEFRPAILCGNGRLDKGEQCDDRNRIDRDRCSSDCLRCTLPKGTTSIRRLGCPNVCGDGVVVAGEECDDGNKNDGDGCNSNCRLPNRITIFTNIPGLSVCGNGVIDSGEECDDGNFIPNDECNACLRNPLTCYACGEFGCGDFSVDGENCGVFFSDAACSGTCGLFDIDVPPDDDDIDVCAEPNPFDLPPGTRFRDYEGARHISVCETDTSARYINCGSDGEITVSIGNCNPGVSCEEGACIDDPRWRSECFDSDGGVNPDIAGEVIIFRDDGSENHYRDDCPNPSQVNENFCIDGETRSSTYFNCPAEQHCDGGICVPGDPPDVTCEDSDGGASPGVWGEVTIFVDGVVSSTHPDGCNFEQQLRETYCVGERYTAQIVVCLPEQHCEEGLCVAGAPLDITCVDSDGMNRNVRGSVTLTREDGAIAGPYFDFCINNREVNERYCVFSRMDYDRVSCAADERCEAGACVPGVGSCSRTGATDDDAGFVTGRDGVVQHDICEGDILHVFQCDAGTGMPSVAENIVCDAGCADGLCL